MSALIDSMFWASLRREEGFIPKISLAFVAPSQVDRPLMFERPLPLGPHTLTKLSPAVERPGVHLGVSHENGDLRIWGATLDLPPASFVIETVSPGLLVVKQSRTEESGKYTNIAVLQGDDIKIIDEQSARLPDCPALLTSLLGLVSTFDSNSVNVLIQLAVSMRAHGRGGTLLVTPSDGEHWRESIIQPITYAMAPRFSALADLMQKDVSERPKRRWQDALGWLIDGIAGLTAVDGATLITANYEVLAFGAKIVRRSGSPQISQIIMTEPIEGGTAEIVDPIQIGGTRHISAAQFVHDQRESIALVASQDGRFTVFAWSPCERMVHAHRIDALLL
jgi:hypothetical protein